MIVIFLILKLKFNLIFKGRDFMKNIKYNQKFNLKK